MTRRVSCRIGIAMILVAAAVAPLGAAETDRAAKALAEVRDVKADMFSRHSSVLGQLPSPAELAAAQMRTRPIPQPTVGGPGVVQFTAKQILQYAKAYKGKAISSFGKTGRGGPKTIPLGVTGAHVVEFLGRSELFVGGVESGSPADGVLKQLDVVIGANGRLFVDSEDPRYEMGGALVASQTPQMKGALTLQIVRDGAPMNVRLTLPETQAYSATWPFDCPKSSRLRAAALRCVLDSDMTGRYSDGWSWVSLFLLASGDDEALERARRLLYRSNKDEYPATGGGVSNWGGSYRLISLCEYYLLTGDSAVLPELQHLARVIGEQQYPRGGWTHGAPGGYGQINCAGLPAFIGMILARECGAKVDEDELALAIRYFGKWCGTNLPYGEGAPGAHSGRMDNGMNSMSAVAFHLLGEKEMAVRWARSVCYMWMGRDKGHAEGIFSHAWGPIGASLAPKPEFHMFLNRMQWYYEMGRTTDDAYVYMRGSRQPYPGGTTSAMAWMFYLPERRLRVMGADKGVFSVRPPAALAKAALLYKQKKWDAMKREVVAVGNGVRQAAISTYGRRLLAARARMERNATATLALVERNLAAGEPAVALAQLDALKRSEGGDSPAAARLRASASAATANKSGKPVKREYGTFNPKWVAGLGLERRGGIRDGFAHSPDYIASTNALAFDGMSPVRIAPYLAHFNGGPYSGAVKAMVAHGKAAVPLMVRLLADENPWLRGAAVNVLGQLHRYTGDGKVTRTIDPALAATIARLGKLVADPHPAVQGALGSFVQNVRLETPETRRIVVKMAGSDDAGVRYTAVNMARTWLADPDTLIRVGMLVSASPKGNTPRHWQFGHMAIARCKADPRCRQAIPVMAAFIRNTANTVPVRGFFSDSAQRVPIQVMAAQWDLEVQRMDNVIPALCNTYVRTASPRSYAGWRTLRAAAKELLEKLDPSVAPALRAAIAEERAFLATVGEDVLTLSSQLSLEKARETSNERIAYLETLATKLERVGK